ncbi:VOC family protein [Ruicaihuangia caeni]|uniref:VOC family protein n=1 Tax=Ruicaihuangia caeni TaxID=3042517 RepID=A0AAW6T9Z6_9MICO|nr:VOC family protein [Klugiella sp. YN-L-19]MDI2099626.1 VOC family protein [Klugiella sp. YN-L-19]
MNRPIHFEIHADDVQRARAFYEAAFGWTFEDWTPVAGVPYLGAITGEEGSPGINGAILQRGVPGAGPGAAVNGAVLTMGVDDYDSAERRIMDAGGEVALPKQAITGMAWQGYYLDTEGNVFGIHQRDETAK